MATKYSTPNNSCVILGGGASGQAVATLLKKKNISTIIVQANCKCKNHQLCFRFRLHSISISTFNIAGNHDCR